MKAGWLVLGVGVSMFGLAAGAQGSAEEKPGKKLVFPTPTATFRPGPGVDLAMTYCALCHSPEYLSNQPPFARTFWKETVEKMRKSYGAPIPEDRVEPLADYLVKAYGVETPP